MSEETPRSILVVDDDDTFRTRLVRAFADRGFDARGAANGEEALRRARTESPEYAVVDLRMPGDFGLDVVRALREIDEATRIVVLTGYGSIATAIEAIRMGAVDYLTKPADADQILAAFETGQKGKRPEDAVATDGTPSLARVEWEHIQRVLMDCSGNVSQAARLLGLHRRSLQRKLSKRPMRR
ncbi:response regulator transcription factor [Pendulispora rubella]|uniref:Response regulator transcription factor n=1 Tax=Pendulispora rubella TaxID=2741070 RepID=A0ABZ2KUZ6_9BACT